MAQKNNTAKIMVGIAIAFLLFIISSNTVGASDVFAWGLNAEGQLGNDTIFTDQNIPIKVNGLTNVADIEAGSSHTIALKSGNVWTWGGSLRGQVGYPSLSTRNPPTQLSTISNVIIISSGSKHNIAVKSDGTVKAWGDNYYGQLGSGGSNNFVDHPVSVLYGPSNVIGVATGNEHSIILTSDGAVWAWGRNDVGQVGDGTTTIRQYPTKINGIADVADIAGGSDHSIALKNDGTVWTWGWNVQGQLGLGTSDSYAHPVPEQVNGLTHIIAIDGGFSHTIALKNDGTVWAWGSNSQGELGDNTTVNRFEPGQVHGLTNVVAVASGSSFNIALKNDGTVWTWGLNGRGQLGDGTTINRLEPVQVYGLSKVSTIGTGSGHAIAIGIFDITPPIGPIIDVPTDNAILTSAHTWVNGTISYDTTNVTIYLDGLIINDSVSVSGGIFNISNVPLVTDGPHKINVSVKDSAGNINTTNTTVTVTVDTLSPTVTIDLPVEGYNYNTDTVAINVSADESVTWQYSINGTANVTFTPNETLSSLPDGNHNVTVYGSDLAGNIGSAMVNFTIDTTAPIITITTPRASSQTNMSGWQEM